jgi:hypothetical protein
MILNIQSNAPHCSQPKARLRIGGLHHLSSDVPNNHLPNTSAPPLNGAIHVVCGIMRSDVLPSATEAKLGALFVNAQDDCVLRNTLIIAMGWPQPTTPVQTDNSCAEGIINDTVKQRHSKAIDMRFYWVRDRVRQGHSFESTGKKAVAILLIISPSTILHSTIASCALFFCTS